MNDDIKSLLELKKSADEQLNMALDMFRDDLKDKYGVKMEIVIELDKFTKEQIELFSSGTVISLYNTYKHPDSSIEFPEELELRVNALKENLVNIKKFGEDNIISLIKNRDEIYNQINSAMEDYDKYINSDEYKENETKKLEELRKKLEETEDSKEKLRITKRLEAYDKSKTMNYLLDRINEFKDKEIKSIIDSFTTKSRFLDITRRFATKIVKLGYKDDITSKLADIEYTFCGKDFYKYNNLFLFINMRMIVHTDVNDVIEVSFARTSISNMFKLIYHKFSSKEDEDKMIEFIKSIDLIFENYSDLLIEKNITSPDHPERRQLIEKKTKESIANAYKWILDNNFDIPVMAQGISDNEILVILKDFISEKTQILELRNWCNAFNIDYDENDNIEKLQSIKDEFLNLNKPEEVIEEVKEEGTEVLEEIDGNDNEIENHTIDIEDEQISNPFVSPSTNTVE